MNVRRQHRLRNDPQARSLDEKVARLEIILSNLIRRVNVHTESLEHQDDINKEVFKRIGHIPAESTPDMKNGYDFAFDDIEKRLLMLEDKTEVIEEVLEVEA